jgi:hypothetical protein
MNLLPVAYKGLSATVKNDNAVSINWDVLRSNKAGAIAIEHSADGITWQQVGKVKESNIPDAIKISSFVHYTPLNGKNYYRLQFIGQDKSSIYSESKAVIIKDKIIMSVWPNPSDDVIHIQNNSGNIHLNSKLSMYDQSGRKVLESQLKQGTNILNIHALHPGIYTIDVQLSNGGQYKNKIVKK